MPFDELSDEQNNQIARGFDATPELIPFIQYLLQDLWELGSSPQYIIDILKLLGLPKNSTILDLACGKGAVSLQIAKALGYNALGLDLFEPFIKEAKQKALELGLKDLCKFEVEDIHTAVQNKRNFDIVILASAESLLGNIKNTITLLRKCVRQEGFIIFDSSYRRDNSILKDPNYSVIEKYDETISLLTSQSDEIVYEVKVPIEETKAINDSYTSSITRRANELTIKFPEKKELLLNYVKRQEEECKIINEEIVGCIWCLRKK